MTVEESEETVKRAFNYLQTRSLGDLIAHKHRSQGLYPILSCIETTTVLEVLDLLQKYDLVALPVHSVSLNESKFLGIVSLNDILEWLLFQDAFAIDKRTPQAEWFPSLQKLIHNIGKENTLKSHIKLVLGIKSHKYDIACKKDTVAELITRFSSFPPHVYRVFVSDDADPYKITSTSVLLSQSDLIAFLYDEMRYDRGKDIRRVWEANIMAANELFDEVVKDGHHDVQSESALLCSSYKANTLTVFRHLFIYNLQAIALIDDEKRLVGTLSASDLRGLNKETLPLLDGPLVYFMHKIKPSNIKKINEGGIVTRDYSVERAVRQMLSARIHRVWLVDDNSVPVGCVSMSDVLAMLVPGNLKVGLLGE